MHIPEPAILGSHTLSFEVPLLMGIVNVTPDSFSNDGHGSCTNAALRHIDRLIDDGAAIIDIGAESTRPGSQGVDAQTEIERLRPVFTVLASHNLGVVVSIDTQKPQVAQFALDHGAHIINDIGGLRQHRMCTLAHEYDVPIIAMHMRGTPETMQNNLCAYDDVVSDVDLFLRQAVDRAVGAGVARHRVWVDPGVGFGKSTQDNIAISRGLAAFATIAGPVVYGPSRKRFLGELTGLPVTERDTATAIACALTHGAHVYRVHDVAKTRAALLTAEQLRVALVHPQK